MLSARSLFILTAAACLGVLPAAAHAQLNLLCSAPADWCKLLADEFGKDAGVNTAQVADHLGRGVERLTDQPLRAQAV